MAHHNRKFFKCRITGCDGKHYARHLCRRHYDKWASGGLFEYPRCKLCGSKVVGRIKEELCYKCFAKEVKRKRKENRPIPKWGYDQYRGLKKHLKKCCDRCKTTTKRLLIHHKDVNRRNCDPKNLQTLCHKCHAHAHAGVRGRPKKKT